jgi:hypothetical protein
MGDVVVAINALSVLLIAPALCSSLSALLVGAGASKPM